MNLKLSRDTNGNRVLKVTFVGTDAPRGFSVQTLGNLPGTHCRGIDANTKNELFEYIKQFGTTRQQDALRWH